MIRVEMYHERVGRGYLVGVWDNGKSFGDTKCYDVELAYGGRYIATLSKESIGDISLDRHYHMAITQMRRLMFLLDGLDAEYNNKLSYSKNMLMNEPKDGCFEEWYASNDRIKMLEEWINEEMKFYGDQIYAVLKNEFMR